MKLGLLELLWRGGTVLLLFLAILNLAVQSGVFAPSVVVVSTDGSDFFLGTQGWPVHTVQAGLDRVRHGGTVLIEAGTYAERVHIRRGGSVGKPTTLAAREPGKVCLTWFTDPVSLQSDWKSEGGLLVRKVDWPVARVRVNGEECYFTHSGLKSLKDLISRPNAMAACTYEAGQLYLYVPAGMALDSEVVWNREVPEPREWGQHRSANIWIEADHVLVKGLHLQGGVGSAVRIWNANGISITDCAFSGADFGVDATNVAGEVPRVAVQQCLYHNYPQHLWRREWLNWGDVYANYANSCLIKSTRGGATVSRNVVTHFGDGLQLTADSNRKSETQASHNWLAFGTDDSLEAEGAAVDIDFHSNVVVDCHESLGLSPVTEGPVMIRGNLFMHPHIELNGAQIKFVPPERRRHEVICNIHILQNQFVGNWLCWYAPDVQCADIEIRENRFSVRRQNSPPVPTGVSLEGNDVTVLPEQPAGLPIEEMQLDPQLLRRLDIQSVPGPSWWNWDEQSATRELAEVRLKLQRLAP